MLYTIQKACYNATSFLQLDTTTEGRVRKKLTADVCSSGTGLFQTHSKHKL